MTLQGGRAYPERNATDPANGRTPSVVTSKDRQEGIVAPAWGTIVTFNGADLEVGEGSVSINHQLGYSENSFSREVYLPPPIITGTREVTFSTRVSYPFTDKAQNAIDIISYAYGRDVAVTLSAASMTAVNSAIVYSFPVTPTPTHSCHQW